MSHISYILNFIPQYAFGRGLSNIVVYDNINYILNYCSVVTSNQAIHNVQSPWNWYAVGQYIFYLLASIIIYLVILVLLCHSSRNVFYIIILFIIILNSQIKIIKVPE